MVPSTDCIVFFVLLIFVPDVVKWSGTYRLYRQPLATDNN